MSTQVARRVPDRWIRPANVGLAILGVLVTHESAYSLAASLPLTSSGVPEHDHQALLWTVGIPLALWAVVALVLRQAAQLGVVATISGRRLGAAVAGLYLVQETAEVLVDGHGLGALVANRAVVVGLVMAPLVASLLLRLLALTSEIVAGWLATDPPLVPSAITDRSTGRSTTHGWNVEPGDPRGPPIEPVPQLTP